MPNVMGTAAWQTHSTLVDAELVPVTHGLYMMTSRRH